MSRLFSEVYKLHLLLPGWEPKKESWYCLRCIDVSDSGEGWSTEYQVKRHLDGQHDDEEPDNGVDYCIGSQLEVVLERWREVNNGLVNQFERSLCSIQSVEDFLFETGKG